jgi:replication-associated recombination protein RarA
LIGSETLVQMAVEELGLAAPEAVNFCLSALAERVAYIARASKSNAVYTADLRRLLISLNTV